MGAPEVLGEQVSTPFAGHDLPGVLREQLHGLSDPSDPRRSEPSRNEEPALMAHWAPERVTAPQRAGDALSRRNGMDPEAFATTLGPKRCKNPCLQGSLTGDQGCLNCPSVARSVLKSKW